MTGPDVGTVGHVEALDEFHAIGDADAYAGAAWAVRVPSRPVAAGGRRAWQARERNESE